MTYFVEYPYWGGSAHRVWYVLKDFIEPIEDEM